MNFLDQVKSGVVSAPSPNHPNPPNPTDLASPNTVPSGPAPPGASPLQNLSPSPRGIYIFLSLKPIVQFSIIHSVHTWKNLFEYDFTYNTTKFLKNDIASAHQMSSHCMSYQRVIKMKSQQIINFSNTPMYRECGLWQCSSYSCQHPLLRLQQPWHQQAVYWLRWNT
jgi:hypothetical protein